ncbi:hypothetical protein [uncultured Kocuria sp.]|uniref:hypothetical protein n=1 Tax=uncultured Kocuria sp. TaxID=259305 RepID=UPI00260E1724|nr:hypothetical protein [uncultured Kocuria sp.]
MTAVKKWVAAGSSAAVLAGGLFLGAPAAHADTCVAPAASTTVTNLVTAADHLYDTGAHFNSLVTDQAVLAQLQTQQAVLEDAIVNDATMDRARGAWTEILNLQESYAASTDDPAVDEAYAASSAAAANFRTAATEARAQGEVFMEDGADLVALFQNNCEVLGTGTGGDDWSDSEDWAGAGTDTGVNQGINMQTAEEGGLSTGVLAGLLAAGAAVSGAVAFRMRRGRA